MTEPYSGVDVTYLLRERPRGWLRYLNPFYAARLESEVFQLRDDIEVKIDQAQSVALNATQLAISASTQFADAQRDMVVAAAGIQNVKETLTLVSTNLACGRAQSAKDLVDGLLSIIRGDE